MGKNKKQLSEKENANQWKKLAEFLNKLSLFVVETAPERKAIIFEEFSWTTALSNLSEAYFL